MRVCQFLVQMFRGQYIYQTVGLMDLLEKLMIKNTDVMINNMKFFTEIDTIINHKEIDHVDISFYEE